MHKDVFAGAKLGLKYRGWTLERHMIPLAIKQFFMDHRWLSNISLGAEKMNLLKLQFHVIPLKDVQYNVILRTVV